MSDEEREDLHGVVRAAERKRAAEQLREGGLYPAVSASRRRHDQLFNATLNATGETIACARGCGFCCSFRVAVRADEVFLLVDHLRATREADAVDRIRRRVVDVAARFSRMTAERRMRTNAACALLEEGACSVYDVRPHTCRAHHAVDVEGCRLSVEDPERSDIFSGSIPAVEVVCSGHGDGLVDALEELGLDVEVYEMNAALAAALTDEAPRRRYVAGEAAFPGARFDD